MVDEGLLRTLKSKDELLSWNGYLLVETSFHSFPLIFEEILFEIQSRNLIPVYAHPERYPYYFEKTDQLIDLKARGILLQVNAGSISGYYGSAARKMARNLLKSGLVDFIGSDAHGDNHMIELNKCLRNRALFKEGSVPFKNTELIS